MDLTPYFGGIISALVFILTAWIALKTKWENRFAKIEIRQASQDEKIERALSEAGVSHELTIQIASIATKLDILSEEVKKHNDMIERLAVLERDTKTAFHKIDELREEFHEIKIGGTS
jgi:uncharacterized coiled-coil protein SlyX